MNNIELVLDSCKNYDEIIKFKTKDNDGITRDLIDYYENYVFLNYEDRENIKALDIIMHEYVSNKKFYDYIQNRYKNFGDILPVEDDIKKFYNDFQEKSVRTVDSCRWI